MAAQNLPLFLQISAKYSLNPFAGYFDLPKSLDDIIYYYNDYVQIDEESAQMDDVNATLWCQHKDPRVCLIFDKKGNNVGIQISVSIHIDTHLEFRNAIQTR